MAGILKALKDNGFQCYAPNATDELVNVDDERAGRRPGYQPFETPRPKDQQLEVPDSPLGRQPLFRYFLDGSMRTTNAGHIVDTKHRFLPIFIAQIGVAATRLDDNAKIVVETYNNRDILFLPETFPPGDIRKARNLVRQAAHTSRLSLDLDLEPYEIEDKRAPIDGARKKVLSSMHTMEIDLIADLADSGKVTRDSLLMIDGSLQFYKNLERAKEAFHNVVGVAKSFDLNQSIGKGQVGTLVATLKPRHRTPARKIGHRNLTIGAWYLRLHSEKAHTSLASTDGVVKIEVFPEAATGKEPLLEAARCTLISKDVLALRHPTTPWTDSRWASHLYPIHVTEDYIKTRFRSELSIRACL